MDSVTSLDLEGFISSSILQPFFAATNSSTLNKALENLLELAKTRDGRSDLASKNMVNTTLQLYKLLSHPSSSDTLLLGLKLIRILCNGELQNQKSFIKQNGVDIVSNIISSEDLTNDSTYEIIGMGLQVLALMAHASLGGKKHKLAIWNHVYSFKFVEIAKIRRKKTCDPLCMIIYGCIEKNHELVDKLCSDHSLSLLVEIIRSAYEGVLDIVSRPNSTGSNDIDALRYSLCILRGICEFEPVDKEGYVVDLVDPLLSLRHVEMLLNLLCDVEPAM